MPDYDETDGWIFSDEYHQWQSDQSMAFMSSHRFGEECMVDKAGWYIGLFTVKSDQMAAEVARAAWPDPNSRQDLYGPYHDGYYEFTRSFK
jgi:hypothetical protein